MTKWLRDFTLSPYAVFVIGLAFTAMVLIMVALLLLHPVLVALVLLAWVLARVALSVGNSSARHFYFWLIDRENVR